MEKVTHDAETKYEFPATANATGKLSNGLDGLDALSCRLSWLLLDDVKSRLNFGKRCEKNPALAIQKEFGRPHNFMRSHNLCDERQREQGGCLQQDGHGQVGLGGGDRPYAIA